LEYTKIPKVFFTPHHDDDVNWAIKGTTNATMVSGGKCYSRSFLQQLDPGHCCNNVDGVIVATKWSNNMMKEAADRQADVDGTIRYFSLTLKRKNS
jgi:hypothetical protein